MEHAIMYQAVYFSIGRSIELDFCAYFTSKQKAIDWCREKAVRMPLDIDVTPNADLFIGIREWRESEGRYMHAGFHRYEWYLHENESKTDRNRNRYHYGLYPETAQYFQTL